MRSLMQTAIVILLTSATCRALVFPGVSTFVAPAGFPTSVFSSYYVKPQATAEPQPAIYDSVLKLLFPFNLTDPASIPKVDNDPVVYPKPIRNISDEAADAIASNATRKIMEIIQTANSTNSCSKCISALIMAQQVAQLAPAKVPDILVKLCKSSGYESDSNCEADYAATSFGAVCTQVLALADVGGLDGQYICHYVDSDICPSPTTSELNATALFPKPKPANATAPKASGRRVKVLQISDIHLDPRYTYASEANCTDYLCCRPSSRNSDNEEVVDPAPLYGAYLCDSPYYLLTAALESIGPLTGTGNSSTSEFAWSIYTGDLVSHDSQNQLSRAYTEYSETAVYDLLKKYISGPIFPVLGNHDTNPEAVDAPHALPGPLGQQMSWNFDHVASLWQHEGWLDANAAREARLHYGAYSIKNHYGLRIIGFNTDFWYRDNVLNYINTKNPDVSGTFEFMISELQAAEDAGERVWIIGHVLSGWSGTDPMPNPTNLFYQIIERYSPHVIANVFFGHTHEDEVMIYYANNGTARTASDALNVGWIGPSITPLTNLNSGYRMYVVDTGDFKVYDAYTFYADVNGFDDIDVTTEGATFQFEYSTRETYGTAIAWPDTAPLDAVFWHRVTEQMKHNATLVHTFNAFQGKSSIQTPNCTSAACIDAKICYMRSGSTALGRACAQGFDSVQSSYTG